MPDWSDARLDRMKATTDVSADTLVAEEVAAGRLPALYAWLGDRGPASPAVAAWLAAARAGMGEVDIGRIRRGQALYARYSPQAILGLLCKGLPESYASPQGAAQLLVAGRFATEPRARLMETARFLDAVMDPGGFEGEDPRSIREILKVRLVHAVARRYIAVHPTYEPATGAPINQEYLAGTLMAFSSLVLDALALLGVTVSDDAEEDYFYVWRVVAPLLGLTDVPVDVADGRALFVEIRRRNHAPSPAGVVLTKALLQTVAELVPGEALDDVGPLLVRHLCGPAVASYLGVPAPRGMRAVVGALNLFGRVLDAATDSSALTARIAEPVGRALYDGILLYGSGGKRSGYVPPGA